MLINEKKQISQLEKQLKQVSKIKKSLLKESQQPDDNNIYIKTLDESTGESTYSSRNFDEYLLELEQNKTKSKHTRYDEAYDVLNESIAHETTLYFDTPSGVLEETEHLNEVDWEERAAELEAGGETEEYDAEGNPKPLVQKTKEKIGKGVESIKQAYKKGKFYFFLKIVEQGLKLAVKISRGILPMIRSLIVKKIILPLLKAWAQGKTKITEVFSRLKDWGTTKLTALMKKVMKPFGWITEKISGLAEKAPLYAPVLISICGLCLILAIMYATTGLAAFESGSASLNGAVDDTFENLETLPNGKELIDDMCLSEGVTGVATLFLLKEEICGLVDEAGKSMSNEVRAAFMHNLKEDINYYAKEAEGNIRESFNSITWAPGEEQVVSTIEKSIPGQGIADMAARSLAIMEESVTSEISGVTPAQLAEITTVNIQKASGAYKQYLMDVLEEAKQDAAKMTTKGVVVSTKDLVALAKSVYWTHEVQSDTINTLVSEITDGKEIGEELSHYFEKVTVAAAEMAPVKGIDENNADPMKNIFENWRRYKTS